MQDSRSSLCRSSALTMPVGAQLCSKLNTLLQKVEESNCENSVGKNSVINQKVIRFNKYCNQYCKG